MSTQTNWLGHGGSCVENKDDVLRQVDKLLGVSKPPDLEILFVEHTLRKANYGKFHQENIGRFGHAAIKYRLESGEEIVMNVSAPADHPYLVNFIEPAEYFFGIDYDRGNGAVQGGIYNRSYCGLRIENLPKGATENLHRYYKALEAKERVLKTAHFQLVGSRFTNFLRKILPWNDEPNEFGNCTHWSANGLVWASVLPRKHMFPKDLFINLFERNYEEELKRNGGKPLPLNESNIHVVYYKEVTHAKKFYPDWMSTQSLVAPFRFLRNWYYKDLVAFSDVVVEVLPGDMHATVTQKRARRPVHASLINALNYGWVALLVVLVLMYSDWSISFSNVFFRLFFLFVIYFFYFWINL